MNKHTPRDRTPGPRQPAGMKAARKLDKTRPKFSKHRRAQKEVAA